MSGRRLVGPARRPWLVLLIICAVVIVGTWFMVQEEEVHAIDGWLDCLTEERGAQTTDILEPRVEIPLAAAPTTVRGLLPDDTFAYAEPAADGSPRDLIVIRGGREVARFTFVEGSGGAYEAVETWWCREAELSAPGFGQT